ncbi:MULTISPECIES: threonine/serine exporter family protein [Jeotgalibacillus]|uniref:threonine/serine exporter family protein n=1 Tax=Jeotgalibacillus TaxID=157226 RepID=UPI00106ADF79|nr:MULTISPECIES: threonine/serine exporter family protein [Jeotgalibacillus]TFD99935.1 threonine/serine exporter [Jeotgalibacillus sp. R-1-5s-1]
MDILIQIITSFIAAAGFGIIFNAPKESLWKCGFVGMIGWMTYFLLFTFGIGEIPATVTAAFLIAVISQFYARVYKAPIIIYIVSGIIPLVPGGTAYNAMRAFATNDYNTAVQFAAKAFLISGSIAMGIVLSEVINQLLKQSRLKRIG